jgi:hypothetical protein
MKIGSSRCWAKDEIDLFSDKLLYETGSLSKSPVVRTAGYATAVSRRGLKDRPPATPEHADWNYSITSDYESRSNLKMP